MTKMRSILCFSTLVILAFGVNVQAGGDAVAFMEGEVTTSQAAVFAAFLAWLPNEDEPNFSADTAISISNILGAPPGGLGDFYDEFGDRHGTVEFYLWNRDGTLMTYETGPDSPGAGLGDDGALWPCWTLYGASGGDPEPDHRDAGSG